MLPPGSSTVSMFSFTESLGIDPNALLDAATNVEIRPAEALKRLKSVRKSADALERHAVIRLRRSARSWDYIALQLGISRQAARKRYPDVE